MEEEARACREMVATVGRVDVKPNAGNVIPGRVLVSLDVRHREDAMRHAMVERLTHGVSWKESLDQAAVPLVLMDSGLPRLTSGAGHDAMIVAHA